MALHHVSVTPASTPSNLARNLAVDSASVTRLLDRLDNKGMIQRATKERVDRTQDRRVIEIVLTERGINVMREVNPHWQSALSELTEAFKDSERSEERSIGKECVSKCRSRWSKCHTKNKTNNKN